ncbi:unnamed protein product, partial [Polarella glacialis]
AFQGLPVLKEACETLAARHFAWALDRCVHNRKARALFLMRGLSHAKQRAALAARDSQALLRARQRQLRRALQAWHLALVRPRRLGAPLMRAVGRLQQWSLQRLMLHGLELRCEQRLGRMCASKVQAVHAESAVGLEAARRSFEDELRTVHDKADSSLKLLAGAHAREVERIYRTADRQLMIEAWSQWRLSQDRARAAARIGSILVQKLQRTHLQTWRRRAEVHALSYLEVQIDCFDAFAAKRNALVWRVLQRSCSYWTAEATDEGLVAVLCAWRQHLADVRLANCRKRLACQKLATIGVNLLRRSLIYTVRQVDEAHQSRELDHLREELRAARLEEVQRDSFVSELAALQSQSFALSMAKSRSALKEANQDAEAKELHRSWHGWAEHQRFQSLKQMLACLREARAPVGRSRAVLSTWQRLAQAAVTAAPLRTRADLCAQAVVRLREKSVASMALARQRRPLARLAAVAAAARQLRTRQLAREAASCLRCVAAAGVRLRRFVGVLHRVGRRSALQTWQHFARQRQLSLWAQEKSKVIERGISLGELKAELATRPYFQRLVHPPLGDWAEPWRDQSANASWLRLCLTATVRRHRRTQLSSVFGASGLRSWRGQAARIGASADAAARGQTAMHRALNRQKADCERLVELRSRECAARTAKVLLHAWSCASAAERAHQAQRLCAARSLLRAVATLERHGRRAALERWRALAAAGGAEVAAASSIAAYSRAEKLERIRQGGLKLQSLLNHRQTLGVCKALNGSWRAARWQALVRSLDASAAREQRRLRADCDGLRAQLVVSEEEAFRFSSLEAGMAERSDQTREDAEARAWEESAELREELRQALARISTLESERRAATKEVGLVRSELSETTRSLSDQTAQAELRRERAFHEQAQALQQQALTSGLQ